MLYLLLGPDDFSKKAFIDSLVKDKRADLAVFKNGDELPQTDSLLAGDLFSRAKVFVFDGIMPQLPPPSPSPQGGGNNLVLDRLITSVNTIIIKLESLDKRKKENKDLLANKNIIVKEFIVPHGRGLDEWIAKRVKELGGDISKPAVEELAVRLGRDSARETKIAGKVVDVKEIFSLWQVQGEIKKLLAFAKNRRIEIEDVKALVLENVEVDAFEIINAIGEGRKQQTISLMREFLEKESASDEKTAVIQLNALLSDQMRSIAIMQDFIKLKKADADIAKQTNWKSGRIYIMKKIASHFASQKILDALKKLEALDEELKTSQTPPRVLIDMIVAQLL